MFILAAAILWVYIVHCKRDKLTRVMLPYSAALGTTKNNPEWAGNTDAVV